MKLSTRGARVARMSTAEIRKKAMEVREKAGLRPDERADVQHLMEIVFTKQIQGFEYDIWEVEELRDDLALAIPLESKIILRKDVYDALNYEDPMARDTLAHEFGHFFMHKTAILPRGSGMHSKYEDSEWQADVFAAEFLMPFDVCQHITSPALLAKTFGVSFAAASTRISSIKTEKRIFKR